MARLPKQSLTSMSIDALLKLRDEIGAMLTRKADDLKNDLKAIGADYADVGRIAIDGRKSLAGRKIPAKYRGPNGERWAGRGAQPRWMTEAIKAGAKREDFLIGAASKSPAKKSVKRRRKAARKK
jgi:DNA-binding protein H-NS